MQKLLSRASNVLLAVAALLLGALLWESIAEAQVERRQPTPQIWVDYTGTNSIGFNASAGLFIRKGTTVYTGATTNLKVLHGTAVTNTLQIVNGIITAIQ